MKFLTQTQGLSIRLSWLAGEPQGPSCLPFPAPRLQTHHHTLLANMDTGNQTVSKASTLSAEPSPQLPASPPTGPFFNKARSHWLLSLAPHPLHPSSPSSPPQALYVGYVHWLEDQRRRGTSMQNPQWLCHHLPGGRGQHDWLAGPHTLW